MVNEKRPMDSDLADSIAMLEQILEVMPQDVSALQALFNAYGQCGHRERAFEYLGLLAEVAHTSNDSEVSGFVIGHLQDYEEEYPAEVAAQRARLHVPVLPEDDGSTSSSIPKSTTSSVDADISEELALAWKLFEENQLEQEEYSSILNDLTEVSSKDIDVPVSVLHVLNDRGFNQMNRIMNYMSSRSSTPCISLSNFELPETVASVLPLDIAAHDGALPFAFFGNDLLVAVLNPFNSILMDKVEKSSGHRCHAYLVSPVEYDEALGILRGLVARVAA